MLIRSILILLGGGAAVLAAVAGPGRPSPFWPPGRRSGRPVAVLVARRRGGADGAG
jgi:hypothetical protein